MPLPGPRGPILTSASLICVDLLKIGDEVRTIESLGIDWLHIDLADDHFVPNLGLNFDLIQRLQETTSLALDVHLMLENVERSIERLLAIGVQWITFHVEATVDVTAMVEKIHAGGAHAGLIVAPHTPIESLWPYIRTADLFAVLCVEPGFAGRPLVPGSPERIRLLREHLDREGSTAHVAADGNVSFNHIPEMVRAGADVLVLGSSSLFRHGVSYEENMEQIRKTITPTSSQHPSIDIPGGV